MLIYYTFDEKTTKNIHLSSKDNNLLLVIKELVTEAMMKM